MVLPSPELSPGGGAWLFTRTARLPLAAFGAGNLNPRGTTRFEPGEWFSTAMEGQGDHLVAW